MAAVELRHAVEDGRPSHILREARRRPLSRSDPADHVDRPLLGFDEDAADIFAEHAQRDEMRPPKNRTATMRRDSRARRSRKGCAVITAAA
jgi:hypothetical protein